jgi:hypothetical protein
LASVAVAGRKNVHKYVIFRLEQSIRLMSEKVFAEKRAAGAIIKMKETV